MGGQDGGQVLLLAVLRDDAEAGEGTFLAGDVERRVAAVVHQTGVTAGLQQLLHHLGLFGDHSEVEGRLRRRPERRG